MLKSRNVIRSQSIIGLLNNNTRALIMFFGGKQMEISGVQTLDIKTFYEFGDVFSVFRIVHCSFQIR